MRRAAMPVVQIRTTGGTELGVATDDGILFLGRTAQKGPAKVLYHLGPAPIVEVGEIRRAGASIYRVVLDVDVPTVPISFDPLRPGEPLALIGYDGTRPWWRSTAAAASDIASGTIVGWPSDLRPQPAHVGAGVFRETEQGLALVGLLKATATIDGGGRYLVLAGLPELRLAFLEPQPAVREREVLYRADGTRVIR